MDQLVALLPANTIWSTLLGNEVLELIKENILFKKLKNKRSNYD